MAPDRLAIEAESRGYSSVYFPEHTHLPVRADTPPSLVEGVELDDYRRSLDPLVALGAAASVTTKIRLGTGVLLVAQHDPIVLSKQLATLDLISNGRVTLGIGFGWNAEEAADHGINFTERRQITREKMLCMQALWGEDPCEYHGALIDLQPCWASPKPVQDPRIRTLVGAAAGPGTFRAIGQYGDGWMPIGGAGMSIAIPELRRSFKLAGRDPADLHIVAFGTIPDEAKLQYFREIGVTEVVVRIPSGNADESLHALDSFSRFIDN